jgi:hypothetical protein
VNLRGLGHPDPCCNPEKIASISISILILIRRPTDFTTADALGVAYLHEPKVNDVIKQTVSLICPCDLHPDSMCLPLKYVPRTLKPKFDNRCLPRIIVFDCFDGFQIRVLKRPSSSLGRLKKLVQPVISLFIETLRRYIIMGKEKRLFQDRKTGPDTRHNGPLEFVILEHIVGYHR